MAFLHQPKILLFNTMVALAITTTAVVRLDRETDIAAAATAFWIISFLNLSVPLSIWGTSQAMSWYARRSEQDPLTGLLNRRAFADAVITRLAYPPPAHTHLAVAMVDLDDFKKHQRHPRSSSRRPCGAGSGRPAAPPYPSRRGHLPRRRRRVSCRADLRDL
jgi:hypothetical protein